MASAGELAVEKASKGRAGRPKDERLVAGHFNQAGRAPAGLADVPARDVGDLDDAFVARLREMSGEVRRLDEELPGARSALRERNDHVRTGLTLGVQPQVVRLGDVEREVVVSFGAPPHEDGGIGGSEKRPVRWGRLIFGRGPAGCGLPCQHEITWRRDLDLVSKVVEVDLGVDREARRQGLELLQDPSCVFESSLRKRGPVLQAAGAPKDGLDLRLWGGRGVEWHRDLDRLPARPIGRDQPRGTSRRTRGRGDEELRAASQLVRLGDSGEIALDRPGTARDPGASPGKSDFEEPCTFHAHVIHANHPSRPRRARHASWGRGPN